MHRIITLPLRATLSVASGLLVGTSYVVFIGAFVSWFTPDAFISHCVGVISNPLRPGLPSGGFIPVESGMYIDFAPVVLGIALRGAARLFDAFRESRFLAD